MSFLQSVRDLIDFVNHINQYTDERVAAFYNGVTELIRMVSGAMILIMATTVYMDYRSKPKETDNNRSKLKLEAQKINEFSGAASDWPKWRNRTECALDGSGYEDVLGNRSYASENQEYNRVVYGQLSVATVDGTAHHLVKQYSKSKDGHAAWKALVEW